MITSTFTPDRQAFRAAVDQIAAKAKAKLPECNGRVDKAVALVLGGDVELLPDGTAQVYSQSNGVVSYLVINGHCDCADSPRAPHGLCKHRLSVALLRRVRELLPQVPEIVEPWPDNDDQPAPASPPGETEPEPAPAEPVHDINPKHIVLIQGKPFVKFAGLLEKAHQRGLQSLTVEWTFNDPTVSLAHAVAVFPFGTFAESADSTPENVGKKVALHWRRLSLTRAKARALRDALNCDMVALEELGDQ